MTQLNFTPTVTQRHIDGKVLDLITVELPELMQIFPTLPAFHSLVEARGLIADFTNALSALNNRFTTLGKATFKINGVYNMCSVYQLQTSRPIGIAVTFSISVIA